MTLLTRKTNLAHVQKKLTGKGLRGKKKPSENQWVHQSSQEKNPVADEPNTQIRK